ncbi:hypothetical protein [Planobispora rosea]|uniref:hypothetical protein n=1 Tax=Planobispora rosea TaxID=35762 RepID=UPI00083B3516|nr:hypothetical protein [Planobispora rosea]
MIIGGGGQDTERSSVRGSRWPLEYTARTLGHSLDRWRGRETELVDEVPGTRITWAIRADSPERAYGGGDADARPARSALGAGLTLLVETGRITLAAGFLTCAVRIRGGRIELVSRSGDGTGQTLTADRIAVATGYRPDHSITSELCLDCDPVLGAARRR